MATNSPPLHLQIHALEHRLPAMALGKAAHLQQGRGLGLMRCHPTRARTACTSSAVASGASQAIRMALGHAAQPEVIWRLAQLARGGDAALRQAAHRVEAVQ